MQEDRKESHADNMRQDFDRRTDVAMLVQNIGQQQACGQGEADRHERQRRKETGEIFQHHDVDAPKHYDKQKKKKNPVLRVFIEQTITS